MCRIGVIYGVTQGVICRLYANLYMGFVIIL